MKMERFCCLECRDAACRVIIGSGCNSFFSTLRLRRTRNDTEARMSLNSSPTLLFFLKTPGRPHPDDRQNHSTTEKQNNRKCCFSVVFTSTPPFPPKIGQKSHLSQHLDFQALLVIHQTKSTRLSAKHIPFGLQKISFRGAKDRLLACKTLSFATQNIYVSQNKRKFPDCRKFNFCIKQAYLCVFNAFSPLFKPKTAVRFRNTLKEKNRTKGCFTSLFADKIPTNMVFVLIFTHFFVLLPANLNLSQKYETLKFNDLRPLLHICSDGDGTEIRRRRHLAVALV